MVIPVGEEGHQTMLIIDKDAGGSVTESEAGLFRFVPMLGQKAR